MRYRSWLVGIIALAYGASSAFAAQECRDVALGDGGNATTRLCKGVDGKWQETAVPVAKLVTQSAAINSFRGKVTYKGTYAGYVETAARKMRSLSIEEAFNSISSAKKTDLSGAMTIELEMDGHNNITGSYSATGGLNAGRVTGVLANGQCRLFDEQDPIIGECGQRSFNGAIEADHSNQKIRLERFPTVMNRGGFPRGRFSDSEIMLVKEASMNGQTTFDGFTFTGIGVD